MGNTQTSQIVIAVASVAAAVGILYNAFKDEDKGHHHLPWRRPLLGWNWGYGHGRPHHWRRRHPHP